MSHPEIICSACHKSYIHTFSECPFCYANLKKVDRKGIENTFLDILPDDVLAKVFVLSGEQVSEIYEVTINYFVSSPLGHKPGTTTLHFTRQEDAVKFVSHSGFWGTQPIINRKYVAKSFEHAFESLERQEDVVVKTTGTDIEIEYKSFNRHDLVKQLKESFAIKKAKLE